MPDPCSPLAQCQNLDGRLLLQRTIYGPQFGFASQANLMGTVAAGAGIRPYVDLTLGMTWTQVGLCQGPPTSVMGLAPGEVVSVGIRTRSSRTFSDLVSDAADSSSVSSHSERFTSQHGTQPVPQAPGGGSSGGSSGGSDFTSTLATLAPLAIALFASVEEDGLSVSSDTGSGADFGSAAGDAITGLIDNGLFGSGGGGGGASPSSAVVETSSMTDDILDSISRSESQSHLRQSTVTTTDETEQTIKRTFGNPYLDRSLQLRFIPVFNQFQVSVVVVRATPGIVAHFAEPQATVPLQAGATVAGGGILRALAVQHAPVLRPVASALYVTDQAGHDDGVRRPMIDLLRGLGMRGNSQAQVERGLSWSRTQVRGNGIHVPISAPENVASAWKLNNASTKKLTASLNRLSPDRLAGIFQVLTRTISVFAGTHVEAVPGNCVLPDIPANLKVVVPGGQELIREKI